MEVTRVKICVVWASNRSNAADRDRSEKSSSNFGFFGMAAKKVDALEERLEGEMNQIKETVEERMSSMEGQVADLRDMMKKMLEFQTQSAASHAKGPEAKNTNFEIHREEEEVEIVEGRRGRPHLEPFQREERGGGYGERQGYGGVEPRGAGGEHREAQCLDASNWKTIYLLLRKTVGSARVLELLIEFNKSPLPLALVLYNSLPQIHMGDQNTIEFLISQEIDYFKRVDFDQWMRSQRIRREGELMPSFCAVVDKQEIY
ncbi:hypothetical protein M5K25_009388 [Dendrobium thyrsiflorum]|uniref:Uncharacterized protein n=1 Tax=Dendrobium thyrsiflorum TaxID=117978 RepID=A0ABD0V5D6_DENTH